MMFVSGVAASLRNYIARHAVLRGCAFVHGSLRSDVVHSRALRLVGDVHVLAASLYAFAKPALVA